MKNKVKPQITRVILFVKDLSRVAEFYKTHFGMEPMPSREEGWVELTGGSGGCNIALHRAAASRKSGSAMKVVFGVSDVKKFIQEREAEGLKFGPIQDTGTFAFANVKDPAGNSVQVSSRGLV